MLYVACGVLLVSVVSSFMTIRDDVTEVQKAHLGLIAIASALWAIFLLLLFIAFQ